MAAEIKDKFAGEWVSVDSDNIEAYLTKQGVGMIKRKAALQLSPTIKINVDDGETISVSISAGPKSHKASYKLGDEYTVEGEDGPGKAVTTFADGKMTTVITPKDSSKKGHQIVREIDGGQLVQTMTVDDVVAKRYFKKK